jgi:hypothetical protein
MAETALLRRLTWQLAKLSGSMRAPAESYQLQLGFGQLVLIYKSLQAVRTLGALSPQDELLDDTIRAVDQAMKRAV